MTLGKTVEAGPQNNVLIKIDRAGLRNQVIDEAGASHDRGADAPGEVRVHVGTLLPSFFGSDEL